MEGHTETMNTTFLRVLRDEFTWKLILIGSLDENRWMGLKERYRGYLENSQALKLCRPEKRELRKSKKKEIWRLKELSSSFIFRNFGYLTPILIFYL